MNVTYLTSFPNSTKGAEGKIVPELPAGSYVDGAKMFYRTILI